ncbi:MAG: hypothetical protein QOI80_3288 [Solirubrobacteraceae bacterium]|jgi:hypothetical protein|nr:hypothetical protein [Solirubrobacteraceae bacterium]
MRRALLCLVVFAALAAPARAALWTALPPAVRPPLPAGTDVRGAITRARLTEAIDARSARRWRADVTRARTVIHRLTGARHDELAAVLGALDALAVTQRLTPARMPLAFLTLERNVREWRTRPFPATGERMTFGRDPAVFQYFPGRGVQFHALATAGVANALAKPCQTAATAIQARLLAEADRRARDRLLGSEPAPARAAVDWGDCRRGRLRATLDRLVELSARRGSFTAWEYQFSFGGGTPPWISAMTQATAAQALARGADALGDTRYRATALAALGAFETPPPLGVAVRGSTGREYLMYSFSPGLHILNGFLQSVIGLHDLAGLTGSARAQHLYALGERTARGAVADYDTGAWSRYSLAGRESTLSYHSLLTGFLGGLCDRTSRAVYCDTAQRFTRYQHEPPRIRLTAPRRGTHNRGTVFSVWVSKISDLSVSVTGRHGPVLRRALTLPRGGLPFTWTPPRRGTFAIRVAAVGPEGLRRVERRTVRVREDPRIVAARKRAARLRRQAARRRAHRREARREAAHRRARFHPG